MTIDSNYTVCVHCGVETYAPDDLDDPLCDDCEAEETAIFAEAEEAEAMLRKAGLVEEMEWHNQ